MKKHLLFISTLVLMHQLAWGQFEMQKAEHMLRPGDQHHFILSQNVEPGNEGPNQVWDFSHLTGDKNLYSHMLPFTGITEPAIEGSVILEEFGTQFIFKQDGNKMLQTATILKGGTKMIYDEPLLKMGYPLSYGAQFSGSYSGYWQNDNDKRAFFGNYDVEADAYGILLLPDGATISPAIRVKSTKVQTYNNAKSASEVISYKWYTPGCRYPLLTIIQAGCGSTPKTIQTAYYADADLLNTKQKTQRQAIQFGKHLLAYPNPAANECTLEYTVNKEGPVVLTCYTTQGQKVAEIPLGTKNPGLHNYLFNPKKSGIPSGLIILRLKTAGRTQQYNLQIAH